ncbi:glycosyltransferase family 39 protein [Streptomyces olivochromogenes]|nr:glycosyltransferase family 39 protein [Streptomyces olivochromogenes]
MLKPPLRAPSRPPARAPLRPSTSPVRRRATAAAIAVPAAVLFVLGLWGLDRGGMWRDEAVTFQVARRTVPEIWRLLHGVDAVHGLYYLLMHVLLVPHPGEVLLRLPSVCAAAVTAGLIGALGARLVRPRVGLWAGLLYAVTPMAGHYAQEGRSYALVAAGATGATLLLVRAVAAGGRLWWTYGTVLGVTCWLHELAVLLLVAHAATLALARVSGSVWRGWGRAAVVVVLTLLPMVAVSHAQSAQVAWLRAPTPERAEGLLRAFLGPTPGVYWTCLAFAVVGTTRLVGRRGEVTCAGVALPLAVLPPVVLMLVSQLSPLYVDRYVLYALAGAPLLVAVGADRVAEALRRLLPSPHLTLAGVVAIALALGHQLPLLRQDRLAGHRPDDLGAVAAVAGRQLRPGDPVLFLPSHARNTALTYPAGFRGTRDVALAVGASASGTLYGTEVGPDALRRRLARLDRVWVIAERYMVNGADPPRSPTERLKLTVLNQEFALAEETVRNRSTVRLYVRRTLAADNPLAAHGPLAMRSPVSPAARPRPERW